MSYKHTVVEKTTGCRFFVFSNSPDSIPFKIGDKYEIVVTLYIPPVLTPEERDAQLIDRYIDEYLVRRMDRIAESLM